MMLPAADNKLSPNDELYIPDRIRTKCGAEIDPRLEIWKFRDAINSVSINFKKLEVASQLLLRIKYVFIWYAENSASNTLRSRFYDLTYFLRTLKSLRKNSISQITAAEILAYKGTLTRKTEPRLGALSKFFRKWNELGVDGISEDAIAVLETMRLKGCVKGEAVKTADPIHGPFTDIEFEALQYTLFAAYESKEICLENFVLSLLCLSLGQRPCQYAALKICDFTIATNSDNLVTYILRVPRVKQRSGTIRGQFTERILNPKLGALIENHINSVKARFNGKINDVDQAPMFPSKKQLADALRGFEFHLTREQISIVIKKTFNLLNVNSLRTGTFINITPYRFRYTTGTRAAMEGHGELVIAELLDHSDTQNAGVYVSAVPKIVERIDKAVAMHLAPIAQAFSGHIIDDESKASRYYDPASRLYDPRVDDSMKPMGNCGSFGFCGALAPIACYTCKNFEPWVDGPHEAMLDFMIAERTRLVETTDLRIASINDRTILAVAQVVLRCDELRKGKTDG